MGPLYPSGWALVGILTDGIAYGFLDSKTEEQSVPGFIADSRLTLTGGGNGATARLCTVRTVDDEALFTVSCDRQTAIGTATKVCRRKRAWSGVTTYSMEACKDVDRS